MYISYRDEGTTLDSITKKRTLVGLCVMFALALFGFCTAMAIFELHRTIVYAIFWICLGIFFLFGALLLLFAFIQHVKLLELQSRVSSIENNRQFKVISNLFKRHTN
jgi:high-affinity Fe2+/Pb2+ permease